jgi:sorbitol/mannitol transport system substrate-binding protein
LRLWAEFQAIGAEVGQNMAATLNGSLSIDDALVRSQKQTSQIMQQAGYGQ